MHEPVAEPVYLLLNETSQCLYGQPAQVVEQPLADSVGWNNRSVEVSEKRSRSMAGRAGSAGGQCWR